MSLTQLPFDPPLDALDGACEDIVLAAEKRLIQGGVVQKVEETNGDPNTQWVLPDTFPAAFVAADFRMVHAGLKAIAQSHLAVNRRFCEWGSGLGVVTCMAHRLGFQAFGIEADAALVQAAVGLAKAHRCKAQFAQGTFIPEAVEHLADVQDDLATLARGIADGHEAIGHDPDDFGLVYAYPWPGEEETVETIFDAVTGSGALLLTFRSTQELMLHRKD